jgi:HAD superfamily hydrolase (TIGR01509 family)
MREYLIDAFDSDLRPMPGTDKLLRRLHGHFPLAVASGSPMEGIRKAMAAAGWSGYFHVLVTSEDVQRGKPAPDVFLETARRIERPPEQCLVIEDSFAGLQAAHGAGMPCFVVNTDGPPELAEQAERLYASLAEIEHAHIRALHRD